MTTLAEVRNAADARLATLWANIILPREIAWYAEHGEYAQILYTRNLPANTPSSPVEEMLPVTNISPGDRPGMTAKAVFGSVSIDVPLPFALATHVYNGPSGHGFVGQVWVQFNGNVYTRVENYGPETWRTHDWQEVETEGVRGFAETYLPTFRAAGRWLASLPRAIAAWRRA